MTLAPSSATRPYSTAVLPPTCHGPAISPVVPRNEVTARIANNRDIEILHQGDHIFAESEIVRFWMFGLVNPAIDGAAQVFDERTVETRIDLADAEILVQYYFRGLHA